MPIYEYFCHACGKEFEAMQKITEAPLTQCKYCNGHVSKLISNTTFHLKGGGWYVTDYGGKKAPNTSSHASENTDNSSVETTNTTKTEIEKPVVSKETSTD